MTFPARMVRSADICANRLGEPVTYADSEETETSIDAIIRRQLDPILIGGQVQVFEDHYTAEFPVGALESTPAQGDTITTGAGAVYRVDAPADRDEVMWRLIVRKLS